MNNETINKENENKLTPNKTTGNIKKERQVRERRERTPLAEQKRLINIKQDPDYVYRIVNDVEDRIPAFTQAGYEIVDRDGQEIEADKRIQDPSWKQRAFSQSVGGGITGYMMRIPRKWWEEDQAKKRQDINKKTSAIKLKEDTGVSGEGFYGDIKIEHK